MVKNKEIAFKKPPDKYNCIKVSFDKIIKDNNTKNKIFDCVIRTNKITIKTYQFLRSGLKYEAFFSPLRKI